VRVKRGVTTHGLALNVNTDLRWFAGRDDEHLGSGLGANGLGCALKTRLAPRGDGHARAFGCQQVGNAVADALAGAADDGDLVFQVEVHATPMSARNAAPLVWKILVSISSE
jgi:hypothetical protein